VRWPEDEEHPHPVKAAFMIFGQLFALFFGASRSATIISAGEGVKGP
jgi:hypothetical protein